MIAIHHRPGSFSDKWIEYCDEHNVPYKLVDCYASDIIDQIKDCQGLMWHWAHYDHKAQLFARQLTYSLEMIGKKVFPDSKTCWHYDDKVGQKYLLETIGAPLVPSYVFYDQDTALTWADQATYPKVFKLRNGAGSGNVKLVSDKHRAKQLIKKAFGRGFKASSRINLFKDRLWHFRRDKSLSSMLNISKGVGRLFIPTPTEQNFPLEKNYTYFQDFVPNNEFDDRLVVIGNRCFCIRRHTRDDDFRASGSGKFEYDVGLFPRESISLAFKLTGILKMQSCAIDVIYTSSGKPMIVEISYAYVAKSYENCHGFFDHNLQWYDQPVLPQQFMIEDFLYNVSHFKSK
ncbi:ATP-grasp domain-containing protein [Desulfovermiculus halophilus]|uniref:ATP-grasp domain-containing protein n=1 Tax=Desulfovermiculus halophilus TaxID=339722 RepID=UPI0004872361|nr:hypothetical protein [Desulfovermiculus halophilus]